MATKVFVHVGYGKTATSWLQDKIFAKLDPEIYLGKREEDFPRWMIDINYLDPIAYDQRREQMRTDLDARLTDKSTAIISSEAFTNLGALHQQAHRIKDLFSEPRIVLVLRHPIKWLISNYKYCVEYEDFHLNFEDYLDFGERRTPFALEKRPPFYLPDFFYDETVPLYQNLFGHDDVLVLRYEDFVSQPVEFGDKLGQFLGMQLPGFSIASQEKVLVSKGDQDVADLRMKNLRVLAERCTGNQLDGAEFDRLCRPIERPMILPETKSALTNLFAKHCAAYYPELTAESA